MSLTTVVTVHCEECGNWDYTSTNGKPMLRWLRKHGWLINGRDENGRRVDYCPNHAAASLLDTTEATG